MSETKEKAVSTEAKIAVVAYAKHRWGRGEDLKTAMKNCHVNSKDEIAIIVIHIPEGTEYDADSKYGVLSEVWVDDLGSIHYPENATFSNITNKPCKVSFPRK